MLFPAVMAYLLLSHAFEKFWMMWLCMEDRFIKNQTEVSIHQDNDRR